MDSDFENKKDKIILFSSEDENSDTEICEKSYEDINYECEIPWVEKYRPEKLDDIIEHAEIIAILRNSIKTGKFLHLLLHGPPGTGKTSTIHAVTNELFGPNIIKDRVIELNASGDRGIGTVRTKIISFAKTSIGSKDPNYPCPDFKIVILDEADAMTAEAQAALRIVMESMSKITRFCFICNYVSKIIEPITSRCMKLKFKPIRNEHILEKIKYISKMENLVVSDECLNTIIEISEGDARRTIMNLQNLQYLLKYKKNISRNDIIQMNGSVDRNRFSNFWSICKKGNIYDIKNLTYKLYREGYDIKSVLNYLLDCVITSDIAEKQKATILIELCKTDKQISEGCSEDIQLLNILFYANTVLK